MIEKVYEKLGLFYLGKEVDKKNSEPKEVLTLLKNKHFTTHAAIIGMTGSGKTGLGIGIIEEAAIDNIPSIIIDPKGDMGNLCLVDSTFSSQAFEPWVADEALSKGIDTMLYAKEVSTQWKEGILSWDQPLERAKKLQDVPKTIYTPGASSGVPINIISSLEVPPLSIMEESDTFSNYLKSTVTSLLSLVGITADPLDSKEYILVAQILNQAWIAGENVTIETIIGKIIRPSFDSIGVLPLEDFYPQKSRFQLATKFNALLASPSFSLWLEGENLDIQKLLYDEEGKAKIAIFSIAHLNDNERMFFVTLLLNKYIAWMRRQSGTSALKTLLYMDEIYGFFPPTQNPPSKAPMMLLLKQARAFGVGIVLSTQNPVDLDYKGLSNIGTWFIGRLQTIQDIERVIDGLGGKIGSKYSKKEIKTLLSNLQKRTFFLKSAHLDEIRLFTTRWALSYLKGPLKRDEISRLMEAKKGLKSQRVKSVKVVQKAYQNYQNIASSIPQYFQYDASQENLFYGTLGAKVDIHFYNQRKGIDLTKNLILRLNLEDEDTLQWESAFPTDSDFENYPSKAPKNGSFQPLPNALLKDKGLKHTIRMLKEMLYYQESIELWRCKRLKLESKIDESLSDFKVRIKDRLEDKKEIEIEKLQLRYKKKEETLLNRLARAKERVEKESSDSTSSMIEAGIAVLGALFGRSTPTKIGRAMSKGNKILKERQDLSLAEERVVKVEDDIEKLSYELEDKIDQLAEKYSSENYEVESYKIKPRKTDIHIKSCAVVWCVD